MNSGIETITTSDAAPFGHYNNDFGDLPSDKTALVSSAYRAAMPHGQAGC
jgi:hypothetical protein